MNSASRFPNFWMLLLAASLLGSSNLSLALADEEGPLSPEQHAAQVEGVAMIYTCTGPYGTVLSPLPASDSAAARYQAAANGLCTQLSFHRARAATNSPPALSAEKRALEEAAAQSLNLLSQTCKEFRQNPTDRRWQTEPGISDARRCSESARNANAATRAIVGENLVCSQEFSSIQADAYRFSAQGGRLHAEAEKLSRRGNADEARAKYAEARDKFSQAQAKLREYQHQRALHPNLCRTVAGRSGSKPSSGGTAAGASDSRTARAPANSALPAK